MGMMGGMGGRGMGMMGGGWANGAPFDILAVEVGKTATSKPALGRLPPLSVRYTAGNVPNFAAPTPVRISMGMMMSWLLNGRQYEMNVVADDEKVMEAEPTTWEFANLSPIPHPMHIHNVQFQVVERTASPYASYEGVREGFVDSGWKDTTAVWPGEKVKIGMTFGPHTGMYMYHCHILEHEDMEMMRNIMVMGKA
jgi:FtsP/CotA-like multicopper oxidase with cupredoxin domain